MALLTVMKELSDWFIFDRLRNNVEKGCFHLLKSPSETGRMIPPYLPYLLLSPSVPLSDLLHLVTTGLTLFFGTMSETM